MADAPGYDTLYQSSRELGMRVSELFAEEGRDRMAGGRAQGGVVVTTGCYDSVALCEGQSIGFDSTMGTPACRRKAAKRWC